MVWCSEMDQGDVKDAALSASSTDSKRYDSQQDDAYQLLKTSTLRFHRLGRVRATWRVRILPYKKKHELQGVGAAMTDAAAAVLSQLKEQNPDLFEFTMERLFSVEQGAGLSYLRCPIGSSDYTATDSNYTYADERADDLSSFSIAHDLKYIIPMLKEAQRINPKLQIMGTPWSPPAWMKTNQDLKGISEQRKAAGEANRLKPEYFSLYADYLVRFCQAYAEQGVTVHALTMQNEPQFDAAQYPCMRMTADDQIRLLKELGPKLRSAGLKTKVYIHDHNWVLHKNDLRVVGGDKKLAPIDSVTHVLSDPEAAEYVAGTAWHCYGGSKEDMQRVYGQLQTAFPKKQILCTEATGWGRKRGSWWNDVHWGLQHNWLGGLSAGSALALQWNLALNHKFGPTLRDDSEAMGLVTIDTDTWQDVRFEREYYAMAHVAMAAQPGSHVLEHEFFSLEADVDVADCPLEALAVQHADGTFVLVIVNTSDELVSLGARDVRQSFPFDLPGHSIATFRWTP